MELEPTEAEYWAGIEAELMCPVCGCTEEAPTFFCECACHPDLVMIYRSWFRNR